MSEPQIVITPAQLKECFEDLLDHPRKNIDKLEQDVIRLNNKVDGVERSIPDVSRQQITIALKEFQDKTKAENDAIWHKRINKWLLSCLGAVAAFATYVVFNGSPFVVNDTYKKNPVEIVK